MRLTGLTASGGLEICKDSSFENLIKELPLPDDRLGKLVGNKEIKFVPSAAFAIAAVNPGKSST